MDLSFLIGKPLNICEKYLNDNNIDYDILIYNGKKMGTVDTKLLISYKIEKKVLLYVSDFLVDINNKD